jgi:hypothetical protein
MQLNQLLKDKNGWRTACLLSGLCEFRPFVNSDTGPKKERTTMTNEKDPLENISGNTPVILLSGDNTRTAILVYQTLAAHGFSVRFAASYDEMQVLWQEHRNPIVLLEVSGMHGVEQAIHAALQLKRRDPLVFVGYLADPALHTSGLAGDGIFPRDPIELAEALKGHLNLDS